ncbi:MAG TPA: hypothetical protein VNH11_07200 [Pirellulales bacterium]|nr:hypothetical protein [Pirellulales bacterium]
MQEAEKSNPINPRKSNCRQQFDVSAFNQNFILLNIRGGFEQGLQVSEEEIGRVADALGFDPRIDLNPDISIDNRSTMLIGEPCSDTPDREAVLVPSSEAAAIPAGYY